MAQVLVETQRIPRIAMMPISHFTMTARRGKLPVLKRPSIRPMDRVARDVATTDIIGDATIAIDLHGSNLDVADFLLPRTSMWQFLFD